MDLGFGNFFCVWFLVFRVSLSPISDCRSEGTLIFTTSSRCVTLANAQKFEITWKRRTGEACAMRDFQRELRLLATVVRDLRGAGFMAYGSGFGVQGLGFGFRRFWVEGRRSKG